MSYKTFNLVTHSFDKHDNMTLIDIENDDNMFKYSIESLSYPHIHGIYTIWKYSNFGYIWSRTHLNNRYIILNTPNDNILNKQQYYIKIYMLNNLIPNNLILIAKCTITNRNNFEQYHWSIQDKDTLQWNHINSIRIHKIL